MGNREDWISNDRLKVGLFKKILTQLQETQYSGRGQKKHLTELKKLYYRQRNPEVVSVVKVVSHGASCWY